MWIGNRIWNLTSLRRERSNCDRVIWPQETYNTREVWEPRKNMTCLNCTRGWDSSEICACYGACYQAVQGCSETTVILEFYCWSWLGYMDLATCHPSQNICHHLCRKPNAENCLRFLLWGLETGLNHNSYHLQWHQQEWTHCRICFQSSSPGKGHTMFAAMILDCS